jgi:magnesium transporter
MGVTNEMAGFDTYFIYQTGVIDCLGTLEEGLLKLDSEPGGYLWLDYYAPSKDNLALLIEPLGIHYLSLEDCLDENQIPKINEYETYVHILFNTFLYSDKNVLINEANLFIGRNFIITVTSAGINNPDFIRGYKALIEKEMRNAKLGPSYAMHVILDYIVDQKFTAIEAVGDDLANLEDIMTENHNAFDHALLQRIRQSLMALRKSLFHEREILVKICRNDIDIIPDKVIINYNDIYDHITKFFELTEIYREMVTSLIQTNLSMLNNDIAKAANDTNLSVRRLTLITTIFMPLTLIAGIGGMSEWSMMTGPENWRIAYPVFWGIMMLIGLANYFILKWLERKD